MIKIILKVCYLLLISTLCIPKASAQVEGQKTICNNEPIPAGWIKVDIIPCIGCCGASVGVNSAWYVIKKIDDAPLFTIEKICFDVPIPKGWIKIRSERCACCGRIGEMYSKNHIMRVDLAPLNTEREICYDSPIPAGWVKISVNDKCGGCCGDELGVFGVQYVIKKVDKDATNLQEEPAPLNSVERICQDSPIPAGWVKTGNETCGFCCGSNSLNKSIIKKVDEPGVISVLPSDSLALVDLFNSTNGGSWKNNKNWLAQRKVATWFGVTVAGGRIISLALPSNNLSGPLPESIGNLSDLKILNLTDNKIGGFIPSSIGNLTKLEWLSVFNNQLTGPIPSSIGYLSNLVELWLAINQLTGSLPESIGNLTKLKITNIGANKLTGPIPASIGNLKELQNFTCRATSITGPLPESIGNLSSLQVLDLGENQINGPIPASIGNLTKLVRLYLFNNQLIGPIPASIGSLSNLVELHVATNQLTGPIPASISNLSNLKLAALNNNKFTFDGLENVVNNFSFASYTPQDSINIIQEKDILSVSVGGTLENNTYRWYLDNNLIATNVADSTYKATKQGIYYVQITNKIAKNLILTGKKISYSITSLNQQLERQIKVYPNPASTQLIIELPSNLQVKSVSLFNLQGKQMGKIDKQQVEQFIIHLNHFAKGIYILEINTKEGLIHRRVTVY